MLVPRRIKTEFDRNRKLFSVVALVGPRQSGKTTFLQDRMNEVNGSYVLFDDPDARELFEQDIKKFEGLHIEGRDITILDEVQYCEGAGQKLKYLADTGRKLWVTSFSQALLDRDVISFLVGRVSILRLFPFDLEEFLSARGVKAYVDEILERLVWEHATFGGYPDAVLAPDVRDKKTILLNLRSTMLLKDVVRVFGIQEHRSLERLVKYLALNTGGSISYEVLSSDLGLRYLALRKYIDALEKSHMIAIIQPFYTNKTKEIVKQPRIYFIDTGLRNSAAGDFAEEMTGEIFENYVLTELVKRGHSPKYWRTKSGTEVDLILESGRNLIPIEVKLNSRGKVERSLRSFIGAYSPKRAYVVGYRGEKTTKDVDGCQVSFVDIMELVKELGEAE